MRGTPKTTGQGSIDAESRATDGSRISVHVLDAVADAEGKDPLDLEPVLADVVDPDALELLVNDGRFGGTIEFTYRDYRVSVDGDGHVSVSELED